MRTVCHPDKDMIGVSIESELLNDGNMSIYLDFPYPDGRYFYVGTPDTSRPGERYPLVLALSEDGFNYDKCYILSDDRYTRQYEGRWKSGDYGYPFAYIREGWIYVIVSRQKERMDALKCKISDLR